MNDARLSELLKNGEVLTAEFKRCSGSIEHDVFESICAFLNRFDGDVLLGVEDDGTVVGVKGDAVALRNNIMNVANDTNSFDPVAYIAPEIAEVAPKGAEVAPKGAVVARIINAAKETIQNSGRADAIKNAIAVLVFLMEDGEITIPDIESRTHLSNGSVKNAIRLLRLNGIIRREGANRGGRWEVLV